MWTATFRKEVGHERRVPARGRMNNQLRERSGGRELQVAAFGRKTVPPDEPSRCERFGREDSEAWRPGQYGDGAHPRPRSGRRWRPLRGDEGSRLKRGAARRRARKPRSGHGPIPGTEICQSASNCPIRFQLSLTFDVRMTLTSSHRSRYPIRPRALQSPATCGY